MFENEGQDFEIRLPAGGYTYSYYVPYRPASDLCVRHVDPNPLVPSSVGT